MPMTIRMSVSHQRFHEHSRSPRWRVVRKDRRHHQSINQSINQSIKNSINQAPNYKPITVSYSSYLQLPLGVINPGVAQNIPDVHNEQFATSTLPVDGMKRPEGQGIPTLDPAGQY